jgi:hypothetical protein
MNLDYLAGQQLIIFENLLYYYEAISAIVADYVNRIILAACHQFQKIIDAVSKMSFGLPPWAGLVPCFKS